MWDSFYPSCATSKPTALLIAGVQFLYGFFGTLIAIGVSSSFTSQFVFIIIITDYSMNMLMALVLSTAINTEKRVIVLLWLAWAVVVLFLLVLSLPIIIVYKYRERAQSGKDYFPITFIMFPLTLFMHCVFMIVVYGFYRNEFSEEKEDSVQDFRKGSAGKSLGSAGSMKSNQVGVKNNNEVIHHTVNPSGNPFEDDP